MTRKKIEVSNDVVDEDQSFDDLTDVEQDIVTAISALEGSESARWEVERVEPVPRGKLAGYCDTFTSSEITRDLIKNSFGAGLYKVKGFRANGTYLKQFRVKVATDPKETQPAAATSNNSPTNFLEMMQLMDERRTKARNELLTIMAPVIAAAIPALFNKGSSGNSVQDAVALAAGLKQLNGDGNNQTQMMDLMFKAMEFAKDSASGKGSDSWVDIAKDAVSNLSPLIANRFGGQPAAPAVSVAQPQIQQLAAPVVQTAQALQPKEGEPVGVMALLPWARQTLAYLAEKAKANKDAGLYADWLLDNGPPGVDLAPFIQYLAAPNWWDVLQQFSPGVAPYEGWFGSLRVYVIEAWNEQHAPAPPENADDDEGNVSDTGVVE